MKLANEAQRTIGRRRLVPRWPVSDGVRPAPGIPSPKSASCTWTGEPTPRRCNTNWP